MEKSDAKKRIEKLKEVISHHRYLYHVLDKQEISDAALDSLKHELKKLEDEFPEFVTKDSPTQRVSGEPLEKFEKAEHTRPMLSIEDIFSEDELKDWEVYLERLVPNRKFEYFCEVKIDGLAMSLKYKNGILVRAATRGNGRIGEDVTANVKTIESIPLKLNMHEKVGFDNGGKKLKKIVNTGEIEVRGEVYINKKDFEKINKKQAKKGEKVYANPRNLAAGSVRQLDPELTKSRNLSFIAYDIVGDIGQTRHNEEHEALKSLGFKTDTLANVGKTSEEVVDFWQKATKKREELPYHIDGVVVTINDNNLFDKLGVSGKSPRGIRAFKFAPKQATTIVESIEAHVGRTGAVTPIARLKPVEIGGVTISRATLHNQDEIDRLDVRVGDTVIVERAGDVIPDVVEALKDLRTGKEKKYKIPDKCPVCGGKLDKEEEVASRCKNKDCPARHREYLYFFASKKAFDIDGLGPKIMDQLTDEGLIFKAYELFDLKEGDLLPLERFKEKSARNLVEAIQKSKKISLSRFIYSLGIRHVGEETSFDLAKYFGSVENIRKASIEELEKVPDIGNVVARSIREWFDDKANLRFVEELLARGIEVEKPEGIGSEFQGLTFVFTGTLLDFTREGAKHEVQMRGGEAAGTVSSETDYVVAGENPGSKYDKAKKLGVKIISEKEFVKMIKLN